MCCREIRPHTGFNKKIKTDMKVKLLMMTSLCAALMMTAPVAAQSASPARSLHTQLVASAEGFNIMKATLNKGIAQLRAAKSAGAVSAAVYSYIKASLPSNKHYKDLTPYQKKQIDVLQKQFGTLMHSKEAKYNCKKEVNAAVQRATLEAMQDMK